MNRIYSTVWNEAQGTFVVSHEKSKSKGKPSSSRKVAAQAVTAALLALGSGQALAASSCGVNSPALQTVSVADDSNCALANGDSLQVLGTGSIADPSVAVGHAVSATVSGVAVDAGGRIEGGLSGILFKTDGSSAAGKLAGSIINNGTIAGMDAAGIALAGGSAVVTMTGDISNSGTAAAISGGTAGIYIGGPSNLTGNITNSGTITSTGSIVPAYGIYILSGSTLDGHVTNLAGGNIAGYDGVHVEGTSLITGGIVNAGNITATGNGGIFVSGSSIIQGGINNNGGAISGGNNGISLASGSITGGVTNNGKISGVFSGIAMESGHLSGGVLNQAGGEISAMASTTGTIYAQAAGIWSGGSALDSVTNNQLISASATYSGTNSGKFAKARGIDLSSTPMSGSITNANTGTISATAVADSKAADANGLSIVGNTITGNITNSGFISASATAPSAQALAFGLNISGATIGSSIINSGRIQATASGSSETAYGSYLLNSNVTGGITNSGTITARLGALRLQGSLIGGSILNDTGGTLAGRLSVANDGTFSSSVGGNIVNRGLFNSGLEILRSTVTGVISNEASGTLTGSGIFIKSSSVITGGISNAGTITVSGVGSGVLVEASSVGVGITNSGTISAASFALLADASAVLPTVLNQSGGLISGRLQILSSTNVTNAGTLSLPANISTIAGNYTQNATGIFRSQVTDSTTYGKLAVTGTTTLDPATSFDVVFANTTSCAGLTVAGTLAGAITSTGGLSLNSGSSLTGAVTHNCATPITLTAVKNGNAVDLVASAAPTTWAVTGASGGNGTVSCVSPVTNNGTATCTGNASGGYALASAAGSSALCGTVSVSGNTITAGPVTAACTVTGTFASTTTYAVSALANPVAGGSVVCTPASGIASGGSSTCSGTANAGYTFTNWGGDCVSAGSNATCTLTNITAAKSVTANFTAASTSQTNLPTTANGVTASMSVSGCTAITNAAFTAPTTGAPSNTTFPFGMLGFTLNGCISGPVAVTVTYAQPLPSGATFYKNINGSYSPYSATLGAYTVAFSLRDGHEGDADGEVNGSIRDPGGIGVSAAPVATAAPIPTLSEWGMMFLSSLVAMFGMAQVRRRRS